MKAQLTVGELTERLANIPPETVVSMWIGGTDPKTRHKVVAALPPDTSDCLAQDAVILGVPEE